MQLDYSVKKARESVERRPAPKNRPRNQSVGRIVLLSVAALLVSFGAGVSTGWYLFKDAAKAAPAAVAQPAKQAEPAPVPVPAAGGPEAPLTFYKTLPAGGKGVIGSGLNLKKSEPPASAPRPAPVAAPEAATGADEKQEAASGYVVQIASYRDKPEADKAQAKLSRKGVAAYVVESKSQDQASWYRLRVGRRLTKPEAEQLASEAGKGALVLPE